MKQKQNPGENCRHRPQLHQWSCSFTFLARPCVTERSHVVSRWNLSARRRKRDGWNQRQSWISERKQETTDNDRLAKFSNRVENLFINADRPPMKWCYSTLWMGHEDRLMSEIPNWVWESWSCSAITSSCVVLRVFSKSVKDNKRLFPLRDNSIGKSAVFLDLQRAEEINVFQGVDRIQIKMSILIFE